MGDEKKCERAGALWVCGRNRKHLLGRGTVNAESQGWFWRPARNRVGESRGKSAGVHHRVLEELAPQKGCLGNLRAAGMHSL